MRHLPIILLLFLLTGCATSPQSQMPNAHKYENNSEALQIYLKAYGDGYWNECELFTTDYGFPPEEICTNSNPLLQAAGLDGLCDGESAASKLVMHEIKELKKYSGK